MLSQWALAGDLYFLNLVTGNSQYDVPTGPATAADADPIAREPAQPLEVAEADDEVAEGANVLLADADAAVASNVRAVFERVDRNSDGELTRAELIKSLRKDVELQASLSHSLYLSLAG